MISISNCKTTYSKFERNTSQFDDGHHKAAVEGHLKVIDDAELKLKKYAQIGQSRRYNLC